MSNHPTIAALRAALESERDELTANYFNEQLENGELNSRHMDSLDVAYKAGHEAATERLLPLIEKAVKIAEFYADKKNWGEPTTDIRDWYLIESTDRGKKSRDFLAEIEK